MNEKYVVIGGAGLMGRIVVRDLYESTRKNKTEIVIADYNMKKAKKLAGEFKSRRVKAMYVNASHINETAKVLTGAAVCVNCAQYYFNVPVMKACVKANVHYVDLGGLFHETKKQLKLQGKFKEKNLTGVLGCGGTPGITNVMAKYGVKFLDRVNEIRIRFAGKDWTKYNQPFVVPYSMDTIFDEFMLQPAVFTKGKTKMVQPASGFEVTEFPQPIGNVESFYTLHSEIATLPISFKGKGIREVSFKVSFDKEFVEKVMFLVNAGMAETKAITINGMKIIPREVTIAQLNKLIPKKEVKIKDLEFLKVELIGTKNGKNKKLSVYCKAVSYPKWNASAGDMDTGTPCSVIAQMIANGKITGKGVFVPEECVNEKYFFKELHKRKIQVFLKRE